MKKYLLTPVILVVLVFTNMLVVLGYDEKAKENDLKIESRIALIYDRASGRIIYEKNGNKQTPMASTTKIMTAIVVLENTNLNDVVNIDKKSASIGGSRLGLSKGDKITVLDLLYGLMLRSGNDAASALAIYVGGSIEKFADMMNEKASELGLINTHFVVPHGLDNEGHYTTAYELAKISDYALKNDIFKKIVSTNKTSISINGRLQEITNTNKLLNTAGVYGVKTGFTNGAERCLVTAYKNGDMDIITVIIGANTNDIRTADTKKLIKYINEEFEIVNIKNIIEEEFEKWKKINSSRIFVEKGNKNQVELLLEDLNFEKMIIKKSDIDKIDIKSEVLYNLNAPVEQNKIIGCMEIIINDENIATLEIYNKDEISRKNINDYIFEFLKIIQSIEFV